MGCYNRGYYEIETCTGYMLKLCLKGRKQSQEERGNKGRNTAEGQLEAGPGFPERDLGLLWCRCGKLVTILFFEAENNFC